MKHLLIIFSLFLLVSCGQEKDSKDLVERDGLYYEKFSDKLFTGKVTGLKQGKIKKGEIYGRWKEYWESGNLKESFTVKNGKAQGKWLKYYENGQAQTKVNLKDGHLHGEFLVYDSSGKLKTTYIYKYDKLIEKINH